MSIGPLAGLEGSSPAKTCDPELRERPELVSGDGHKSYDKDLASMQAATSVQVGAPAPQFTSLLTTGDVVKLNQYKGKKVVLYFYPKDDTPGCTIEACGLRDQYQKIRGLGAEILGVSIDDVASHQRFTQKFSLPFQLVADSNKSITKAYDVLNEKSGMARRVTFIIDEKGNVEKIFDPVKADQHTQQVIDALSH